MDAVAVERAIAAATSLAADAGLAVDGAAVVHRSNKLAIRVLPCDVLARVAVVGEEVAAFEVALARALAGHGPVAALDARLDPRVHERDGFAVTFWTYYDQVNADTVGPAAYAQALRQLHAAMRGVASAAPHFTDRVAEAVALVADPDLTPALASRDRELLVTTLRDARQWIVDRGAVEQLLHGEPHAGNVLSTRDGPVFIDLETCCRGPIEFDLAHVPEAVSDACPGVDHELVGACRRLVLAMVAAWRWDARDEFPDGPQWGVTITGLLRAGPPWPTLDALSL